MNLQSIDKWHKTKQGRLAFGLAELLLAYGFGSWALDSGQIWQYIVAVLLFFGGIGNLFRIFFKDKNGHKKR